MAETFGLTTPIVTTVTSYTVDRLDLDWAGASITVNLKNTQGVRLLIAYTGAPATALMLALNKANLSVKSLQRRVLEQLVLDGKLPAGTVTGTPD